MKRCTECRHRASRGLGQCFTCQEERDREKKTPEGIDPLDIAVGVLSYLWDHSSERSDSDSQSSSRDTDSSFGDWSGNGGDFGGGGASGDF